MYAGFTGAVPPELAERLRGVITQPPAGQTTLATQQALANLLNLYRATFGEEPPPVNPGLFG
jgi:hypothetical protein